MIFIAEDETRGSLPSIDSLGLSSACVSFIITGIEVVCFLILCDPPQQESPL